MIAAKRSTAAEEVEIVGVSTDEFDAGKGKTSVVSYEDHSAIVAGIKGVDLIITANDWDRRNATSVSTTSTRCSDCST